MFFVVQHLQNYNTTGTRVDNPLPLISGRFVINNHVGDHSIDFFLSTNIRSGPAGGIVDWHSLVTGVIGDLTDLLNKGWVTRCVCRTENGANTISFILEPMRGDITFLVNFEARVQLAGSSTLSTYRVIRFPAITS